MINNVTISGNSWTAITTPGQSGTIKVIINSKYWGDNEILITHGISIPLSATENFFRLDGQMIISADNEQDVYYARCNGSSGSTFLYKDVS